VRYAARGVENVHDLPMGMAGAKPSPELTPAPRGRKALAGLINAAIMAGPLVLRIRQIRRTSAGGRSQLDRRGGQWWARIPGPAMRLIEEQIGTPGARAAGLRTVDRRTAQRVALWRTVVVALAQLAIDVLQRRVFGVRPSTSDATQADLGRELQAIKAAHANDPDARNHAIMQLYKERKLDVEIPIWRPVAGVAGSMLINRWLRRRLAPTVVVVRAPVD
jgi:hypothetical protein